MLTRTAIKPTKKICKMCKKKFMPSNSTIPFCSASCAYLWLGTADGKAKQAKAIEKIKLENKKEVNKQVLQEKKEKKQKLEKLLTKSDYERKLQAIVNEIARLIDKGWGCISCGKYRKESGGHFHSCGAKPNLRFNLHNIHLQDYECNVHYSGNIAEYGRGLKEIYGQGYKAYIEEELPLQYPVLRLSIPELKEATERAREIVNALRKANSKNFTARERQALREEYNFTIGIYKLNKKYL